MIKLINLEKLRNLTRKMYENCSDIRINQDELENMLTAIDRLGMKYGGGKISKDTFTSDEKKLKKESLRIVKNINRSVASNLKCAEIINKEIAAQKVKKG